MHRTLRQFRKGQAVRGPACSGFSCSSLQSSGSISGRRTWIQLGTDADPSVADQIETQDWYSDHLVAASTPQKSLLLRKLQPWNFWAIFWKMIRFVRRILQFGPGMNLYTSLHLERLESEQSLVDCGR